MSAQRAASLCLLLGLIGLTLAAYLIVPHLGLLRGELLGGAACGGGGAFNCHVVIGSSWGFLVGVPLALWGVVGYIAVIALALLARQSDEWARQALTLLVLLAALFVAIDLVLLVIMAFVIRSYCLLCLFTYAVNLSLLVICARSLGSPWTQALRKAGPALAALVPSRRRPAAWLFWGMLLVGLGGGAGLHAATTLVSRGTPGNQRESLRQFIRSQPRVHVELTGDPMIGPASAPVRIVEFSDLRCPMCQRAAQLNPIVLASHRGGVAFIFKHLPLDTACNETIASQLHPGACQLAAATECAHLQGQFWALHDRIFEEGKDYRTDRLRADVGRLGLDVARFDACMASGEGMDAVQRDIAAAGELQITSTPTYLINGLKVSGLITPSTFKELLALLRTSGR